MSTADDGESEPILISGIIAAYSRPLAIAAHRGHSHSWRLLLSATHPHEFQMPFFKLKRRNVHSSVAQPSDTPVATTPPAPQNESAREAPAPTAPDSVTKPVISPSTRKAALNAFKTTLEVLGKAPLPGIGMVAAAALRVIQGLQVNR
jgi:predicted lipid-binding transport protein (Tim44 family)